MAYISVPSIWRSLPQKYRLVGLRCKGCGTINFPARRICIGCREASEFDEVKLSGKGRIYTYTIIGRGATVSEHSEEALVGGEFPIAVVELEEGIRLLGQITDCDPSEVRIGMELEAVFRRLYEQDGVIRYGWKFKPVRFPKHKPLNDKPREEK